MPNPYNAPEITVQDVAGRLKNGDSFVLLDVREPQELTVASLNIENVINIPLSRISARGIEVLPEEIEDKNTPIVVMCHHGMRSAQVTIWLISNGWNKALNMDGGINAYAHEVDSSIGTY